VLNIVPLSGVVEELDAAIVQIARDGDRSRAKRSRVAMAKEATSG
jgi:hypothetical protein